jgi:HEAT repeat protein
MTAKIISRMLLSILILLPLASGACKKDRTAIARKYLTQEKNDAIRASAIEYLKDCKKAECKELLFAALHDNSGGIRSLAIASIEPSADRIGLFLELLKDPDDRVWLGAVHGLIKIGAPALAALKKAALDKDPFVREGAIVALGKIGGSAGWDPSRDIWFLPQCDEKKAIDKESGDILLRALRDEDVNVRRDATETCACFDVPEAIDSLLKNAEDPELNIRVAAFWSLNGYSDSRIIASAFRALSDPQLRIRQAAAYLLRSQWTPARTERLCALLNNRNLQIRCFALNLAAGLPNEQLNPRLLNELRAHAADFAACAETPATIRSSKIANVLFDIANSSNDNAFVLKISKWLLYPQNPAITTIYLRALRNNRHAVIRRTAARTLSESLRGQDKINPKILASFYGDRDPVVRFWAASFGAGIKDERAIPILELFANNPDEYIRLLAIAGLANLMPATSDYLSSQLLRNSEILDGNNISNILYALLSSDKKTGFFSVLMPALQSKKPDVVSHALTILYDSDEKAGRLQFERLIRNDNLQIRIAALEGIQSGELATKKFVKGITSEDLGINKILLGIIADEKEPEKMRTRAFYASGNYSKIAENSDIRDTLYSILKKKSTPLDLRRAIAGTLISANRRIIEDMLKDQDLCDFVSKDACDFALYPESTSYAGDPLPKINIEKLPRKCRLSIAGHLSKISKITDPFVIEKLQEMGKYHDPAIRAAVATALGEISSSVTLPFLNKLAQDPDRDVREKAQTSMRTIEIHLMQKVH